MATGRRERIKQETRQGILDGARKIAQQDGWSALTIRKLAAHVEYAPSIVYQYFHSKDDVLNTLLREGFDLLAANMKRAQGSTDDPLDRALHVCEAYWLFARDNRELYQVMHGLAGSSTDAAVRAEAVQPVSAIAEETLAAWASSNDVVLNDLASKADIVWSFLHGWVSLTLIDQVYKDEARAKQLLCDGVRALLCGWQSCT